MDIPCAQFQADLDSTFSKKGKSLVENPQRKVSLVSYEKSFREKGKLFQLFIYFWCQEKLKAVARGSMVKEVLLFVFKFLLGYSWCTVLC